MKTSEILELVSNPAFEDIEDLIKYCKAFENFDKYFVGAHLDTEAKLLDCKVKKIKTAYGVVLLSSETPDELVKQYQKEVNIFNKTRAILLRMSV